MAESVSIDEAYELAAAMFGIDEDCQELIDGEMDERFGMQIEDFAEIVEALIPFVPPVQLITLDRRIAFAQGFAHDGAFIVKREVKL